ncbi:MAG: Fic family protein [Alphaproteobacteria bacterium]|nr:Fic family protein [Alphaproteobacteria bacterium]
MIFVVRELPPDFAAVVARIDSLRAQLRYQTRQAPQRWTGLLRRTTFARAIQGSNSIEGYVVTRDAAIDAIIGESSDDADATAWQAVVGYRNALSYILQLAADPHFAYGEGVIKGLHYMMLGHELTEHPGRWRPGASFVRRDPDGDIVYEGPDAALVPALMTELVAALNHDDGLPAMVRAALAHLNLVMIHPFSDGNGRMARALQTMVLAREGVLDPRFSSIEEYLGRNTLDYYAVLAAVGGGARQPRNDALPWVRFCLVAHYRQAPSLLRRSREMVRVWDHLETEARRRCLPERMVMALFDAAFGWRVRNATYRSAAEITENTASRDPKVLVDQGLLRAVGAKRGRSYVAAEWIMRIRERAREPRVATDPFDMDAIDARDRAPD